MKERRKSVHGKATRMSSSCLSMSLWDRFTYGEDQSLEIRSVLCSVCLRIVDSAPFVQSNVMMVMTSSIQSLFILSNLWLFCCLLLIHLPSVWTNEVELRRLLFQQRPYDQKVCPEVGVTKVHTNLILLQIESVDEKAQVCRPIEVKVGSIISHVDLGGDK